VILTCMDHRIDPLAALELQLGDAMVLRNAGGRVTPAFLRDLEILGRVAAGRGSTLADLELILVQHTKCGAAEVTGAADPPERIRSDLETLAAEPSVPDSLAVTGMVYDVDTGSAETVERRAPLRPAA
jgi:carbonic anhydrase